MSYASESGYTPVTIEVMMLSVMENVNEQFGTAYTSETFVGTNFYKFAYAVIQRLQENEVKTSEIFSKLQDYFRLTNERISRPVVTNPGLVEILETNGFLCSVKPPEDADAGKIFICLDKNVDGDDYWEDTDDYAADKLAACTVIKDSTVAGCVTQGDQTETITLSNGQAFDFKFKLPTRNEVLLRLTTTLSENNQLAVGDPDDVKLALIANIAERYRLGKNFEPQKYFNVADDAPWCAEVRLEWSDDNGSNYYDDVFDADFDDLFVCLLENVELVEE